MWGRKVLTGSTQPENAGCSKSVVWNNLQKLCNKLHQSWFSVSWCNLMKLTSLMQIDDKLQLNLWRSWLCTTKLKKSPQGLQLVKFLTMPTHPVNVSCARSTRRKPTSCYRASTLFTKVSWVGRDDRTHDLRGERRLLWQLGFLLGIGKNWKHCCANILSYHCFVVFHSVDKLKFPYICTSLKSLNPCLNMANRENDVPSAGNI